MLTVRRRSIVPPFFDALHFVCVGVRSSRHCQNYNHVVSFVFVSSFSFVFVGLLHLLTMMEGLTRHRSSSIASDRVSFFSIGVSLVSSYPSSFAF
jgi:hypothetical protein